MLRPLDWRQSEVRHIGIRRSSDMKLLLFLAAVTLVSASPVRLVGRNQHELSCSICQHLTQDLHNVISKEDTQTKVVSGLLSRCNGLVSEQSEVCTDIVHSMAPSMVHFITNKIHPYMMCSSMEMCPEEHVTDEHQPAQLVHKQPEKVEEKVDVCEFCQFAINIVERYAHANGSIAKLNATMLKFCNSLPDPFKSECVKFAPAVIKALAEGVPPHEACVKAHVCPSISIEFPLQWKQVTCGICNGVTENMFGVDAGAVCMDLHICLRPTRPSREKEELPVPDTEERDEPTVQKVEAGPGCELCEFAIDTIDQYLKDNHTEAAINATLTKFCNELPEPLKDTCNEFAPKLVQILADGVDPKEACTKIGLCETEPELQQHMEEVGPQTQRKDKADPLCDFCEAAIKTIDELLKDNETVASILETLTKVCNGLPEPLKDMCNTEAPKLVQLLANGVDPKEACAAIGLCETKPELQQRMEEAGPQTQRKDKADPLCDFCEAAIKTIDELLKDNETVATILETLTKVCNGLPEPLKDMCNTEAPKLVQLLADGVDPKEACAAIGLCETKPELQQHMEEAGPQTQRKDKADPLCDFCEAAIKTIDELLKDNETVATILETLTKVCNGLPEPLKDMCNTEAPKLVQLLANGVDPKEACAAIGLCETKPELQQHMEEAGPQTKRKDKADPLCDFCEAAIKTIDELLKDNETVATILETLTKVCNGLPEPLKDMCNTEAPKLVQLLANGVDPKEACAAIGLCETKPELQQHMEEAGPQTKRKDRADPLCDFCEAAIKTIDELLKDNETVATILETLTKVCNGLPEPLKDMCNTEAPKLVQLLANGVDPKEACAAIGLCETKPELQQHMEEAGPQTQRKDRADPGCELCEFVVNVIDQYLKDNHTEAAINATITKICNELPEPLKDTCTGFAPQLIKTLAEGFDPKQACTKIGLCATKVVDEHRTFTEEELGRLEDDPGCELCEFVVNTIDQYLKDNHTEAAINATVTKICNELPDTLKDLCTTFAANLTKVLAQGFDPKEACSKIGLCGSVQTIIEEDPTEEEESNPEEVEVNVHAGPACDLCEFAVNTIDQYLKDNRTEAAINATFTKFCNDLPEPLKDTCNEFEPKLVGLIAQGLNPQDACTKIGLCASVERIEHVAEEQVERPKHEELSTVEHQEHINVTPECELCEFVVNTIDQYLKDNHTEAAINSTLTKFCASLPEPLKDMCNEFAPDLVVILAKGFDPAQACTKIGLCQNATHAERLVEHEEHVIEPEEQEFKAGPGCELCEFVVNVIDQYLKDNHTEAAINATLTKVCNELPEPLKDTCNGFAPQLVKILAQGFDPQQACTKIGLCSSTNESNKHEDVIYTRVTPECELCELIVKTVDKYLTQNATEAFVNTTLLRVCLGLPEPLKSTCLKFAPELVQVISQGVEPDATCIKIKLCHANDIPAFQFLTCHICESSMEKIFPEEFKKVCAMPCTAKEDRQSVVQELVHEAAVILKKPESALTCELCELLVNTLDQYLKNNHSEAAINSTIYKICDEMPAAVKLECHLMAPLLVKQLANGFNVTKACDAIHACDADKEQLMSRVVRSLQEEMRMGGELECHLCKDLIGFIDTGIDADEATTKKKFDDVCHRLPPPTDQKCLDFVDPNFPKIWNEIVHGKLSPEKVCEVLKVCKTENNTAV